MNRESTGFNGCRDVFIPGTVKNDRIKALGASSLLTVVTFVSKRRI